MKNFFRIKPAGNVTVNIVFSILGLLIIGLVFWLISGNKTKDLGNFVANNFQNKPASQKLSANNLSSPSPKTNSNLTFKNCEIKKAGNPLVSEVNQDQDSTYGLLTGTIDSADFVAGTKTAPASAYLTISSTNKQQTYSFLATESPDTLYNNNQPIGAKDFKAGQNLAVSFSCLSKTNQFLISRVEIR